MQQLIVRRRTAALKAYFIWGAYLPTDTQRMAEEHSRRFFTPNGAYYWIPSYALARELAPVLKMVRGRDAWDVYLLYRKGTVWDKIIPEPWYWQHQLDVLQGAPFNTKALDARVTQALRETRG
jgi:hypothetical protein